MWCNDHSKISNIKTYKIEIMSLIIILKDLHIRTLKQICDDEKDIREWTPPIPSYKKKRINNNKKLIIELENVIKILSTEPKLINNKRIKKFCAYCGTKLEHEISTDANTKLICRSVFCKMILKRFE